MSFFTSNKFLSEARIGWFTPPEQPTYSSSSSVAAGNVTAVFATVDDLQGYIGPGTKIRFKQPTDGSKQGICTDISANSISVLLNSDYDFDDEAVTEFSYSPSGNPLGFDCDPGLYTIETSDTTQRAQSSPTQNTWYNAGSVNIEIPAGLWEVSYQGALYITDTSTAAFIAESTLSTANNTESDSDFTSSVLIGTGTNDLDEIWTPVARDKIVDLAASDTYYYNIRTVSAGVTNLYSANDYTTLKIRARLVYL